MLVDKYQRPIYYLRISVTDKCNLRCRYCMPETGVKIKSHDRILRWEELFRMVQAFRDEGVDRVRITGGEPLVRKGLLSFIRDIKGLGLKEISITTNGLLLPEMAKESRSEIYEKQSHENRFGKSAAPVSFAGFGFNQRGN